MGKIKFILNYSNDARDVERICYEKDKFPHYCSSIKINDGSVPLSSFINKSLRDIEEYNFDTRLFNAKSLVEGDIGVLKEGLNENNILYKIKILEIYNSSDTENDYVIDKYNKIKREVIEYIVEKTGKPFQVVKFFPINYYERNANKKLPKANWMSTLSIIKNENIIKELENLNWLEMI